jgi:L-asparaginase / beta-aspartyl-peptidase
MDNNKPKWSLAIHGGAGVIDKDEMGSHKESEYHEGLKAALLVGAELLESGKSALDAVEHCVRVLEDNPLFNAGIGASLTANGIAELDAAIMDGASTKAGAIAGVHFTKNPISLARAVMEKSNRLLLIGAGADEFSKVQGLEQTNPEYFITDLRKQQLEKWRARQLKKIAKSHLYGTVGAVAMDINGNLAAATSTGGITGKEYGRVGDCPIIGAGTIALNGICAVSCTGTGEYFIRESAARQIADRIRWNNQTIESAAYDTIMAIGEIGGDGGLIAMDADGKAVFALNDIGMYRGRINSETDPQTSIFHDEIINTLGKEARTSNELH